MSAADVRVDVQKRIGRVQKLQIWTQHDLNLQDRQISPNSQYISLTLIDLQYLSKIIHVTQTHVHAYILSLPDVLTCVTLA